MLFSKSTKLLKKLSNLPPYFSMQCTVSIKQKYNLQNTIYNGILLGIFMSHFDHKRYLNTVKS